MIPLPHEKKLPHYAILLAVIGSLFVLAATWPWGNWVLFVGGALAFVAARQSHKRLSTGDADAPGAGMLANQRSRLRSRMTAATVFAGIGAGGMLFDLYLRFS